VHIQANSGEQSSCSRSHHLETPNPLDNDDERAESYQRGSGESLQRALDQIDAQLADNRLGKMSRLGQELPD
jgi:hypothetical protein